MPGGRDGAGQPVGLVLRVTDPAATTLKPYLVPIVSKPITNPAEPQGPLCPGCGVYHRVKTVHLWLDDEGKVVVSRGVYEAIRDADAAAKKHVEFVGHTYDPPNLTIGGGAAPRSKQDQQARNQKMLTSITRVTNPAHKR